MLKSAVIAAIALACMIVTAEARPKLDPSCFISGPNAPVCVPVSVSSPRQVREVRGTYIARQVGFGAPVRKARGGVREERETVSYNAPAWTGSDLVSRARSYLGTNPTGWRSLWCARFMAMVAPGAAAKVHNPNYAKDYLALPLTSGNVGDIAVMGRRGGGHVGIVTGFDSSGNPIIISGNAGGGIVREGVYSRSRILAFVNPS